MILIICTACRVALRVQGDVEETQHLVGPGSDFWPDKFSCFRCEGPARGYFEADIQLNERIEVKDVGPTEAYAAIHGLGIMEERDIDPLIVDTMMRETPVRRVASKEVRGSSRVIVSHIELWDGTRLHFSGSTAGAVIYRITRPHHYVGQVKE